MARLLPVNEGGRRIGQGHHRAKLSDSAVDQILALRGTGMGYAKIAAKFGCAKSTVRDIARGHTRGQLSAHGFKRAESAPAVLQPLPLVLPDLPDGDDWTPAPAPSVESFDLPPLTDEEPGQRAMRLVCWAILKEPQP